MHVRKFHLISYQNKKWCILWNCIELKTFCSYLYYKLYFQYEYFQYLHFYNMILRRGHKLLIVYIFDWLIITLKNFHILLSLYFFGFVFLNNTFSSYAKVFNKKFLCLNNNSICCFRSGSFLIGCYNRLKDQMRFWGKV